MYVSVHALLTNHRHQYLTVSSELPVIPIYPVISSKNCHTMEYSDSDSTTSTDTERLSKKEFAERYYKHSWDGNTIEYKDSNSPTTRDLSPPVSPGYLPVSPPRNDSDSASSDPGKTLFPIAEEKKKRKLPAQEKDENDQKCASKYGAEERRKKEQELAAWMKPWDSYSQDDKKFSHKHVAPNHDATP